MSHGSSVFTGSTLPAGTLVSSVAAVDAAPYATHEGDDLLARNETLVRIGPDQAGALDVFVSFQCLVSFLPTSHYSNLPLVAARYERHPLLNTRPASTPPHPRNPSPLPLPFSAPPQLRPTNARLAPVPRPPLHTRLTIPAPHPTSRPPPRRLAALLSIAGRHLQPGRIELHGGAAPRLTARADRTALAAYRRASREFHSRETRVGQIPTQKPPGLLATRCDKGPSPVRRKINGMPDAHNLQWPSLSRYRSVHLQTSIQTTRHQ